MTSSSDNALIYAKGKVTTAVVPDGAAPELTALLQQIALNNQIAFKQLYQLSSSRLFAVLLRMLQTQSVAERVLQDTYVDIWENSNMWVKKSTQPLNQPLVWMTNIARSQAIDVLRDPEYQLSQSVINTDHAYFHRHIQHPSLFICLERLDNNTRECLVRTYCEGRTIEDLSKHLGESLSAIKRSIRTGLLTLTECTDEFS